MSDISLIMSNNYSFLPTFVWSDSNSIQPCPDDIVCYPIILNYFEDQPITGCPPYVLDTSPTKTSYAL